MDNTEAKTGTEQKGKTGAIVIIVAVALGIAFLAWRYSRQRKIDAVMKKVREAKAEKNAVENAGESE